jgi:RIO kinase 1
MRIPDCLASLSEYGIIEEVLRPLMSGKEAQIYLVVSGGEQRVAKVYKEAQNRTFKNRAEYTEGRKVRNSRDQRAMGKGTRHGRAQEEAAWRATEVEMIYRLRDAGVRVPVPYHFIDSVLVMEMVADAEGNPAPRLGDLDLEPAEAQVIFERLLAEVVRMLSAGVVHGDLSDFNVLIGADGPVVIDFPQSVDASSNQNARKLLIRDVDNLHRFMTRFSPEHRALPYAQEMWQLYERGELLPDTKLTGRHRASEKRADTRAVLELIGDANYDEGKRRQKLGLKPRGGPAEVQSPSREHEPRFSKPRPSNSPVDRGAAAPTKPQLQARRVERDVTPQGRGAAPRGTDRGHLGHEQRRDAVSPRERDPRYRDDPQQAERAASTRDAGHRDPPQQTERGSARRDFGYHDTPRPQNRDNAPRDFGYRDAPRPHNRDSAPRDLGYRDAPRPQNRDNAPRDLGYRDAPRPQNRDTTPRDLGYRDAPPQQSERGSTTRGSRFRDAPQQQTERATATRDSRYRDGTQQHGNRTQQHGNRTQQHSNRTNTAQPERYRDAPRSDDPAPAGRFSGSRHNRRTTDQSGA